MIAFDTNILVYGHREDSPFFERASRVIKEHAEGSAPWALLWPCIHEFLAIVTHPRIFRRPTPLPRALAQVEAWMSSPTVVLLSEEPGYWSALRTLVEAGQIQGPKVHDARIAALAALHRVTLLFSADRDFSRFPELVVRNPLA